jgi:hypothetical protein
VSASKHAPGPWQFYADVPSTDPNWHIVTNASRMRVLANVHIEPGNAVDLANARLIAAAPELLEALQKFLSAQTLLPELSGPAAVEMIGAAQAARRAIAKATGSAL